MKLKKDDTVEVMTGEQGGKRGRVLSVDTEKNRVVIEGVNVHKKHVRRSQRNPQGGRLSKELPINASNVMIVCPKCQKPTRVAIQITPDGAKSRICKKCQGLVSVITKAKKVSA